MQRLADHLERASSDSLIDSAEDIVRNAAGRARGGNIKPFVVRQAALVVRGRRASRAGVPVDVLRWHGRAGRGPWPDRSRSPRCVFDADVPDDVAPSAYNEDDPRGGLAASPLAPSFDATASAGRRRC